MATDLGTLRVTLTTDLKKFTAGMTLAAGQIRNWGAAAGIAMKAVGSTMASMASLGVRAFNGIRDALKSFAWYLKWATGISIAAIIKIGADAEEMENMFSVAFEGMTDSVRKWSDDLASRLKVSGNSIREYAGEFQLLLTGMEVGSENAAKLSETMTEVGYAMSRLRGTKVGETMDALKSALAGNTRGLRSLGIVINDTTLKLWAQKNGLDSNVTAWSEQEKSIAIAALVYEKAGRDMANMSSKSVGLATIFGQVKDQIKNLAIEIYTKWRPYLISAFTAVRDYLDEHKKQIAEVVGKWTDALATFVSWMQTDFLIGIQGGGQVVLIALRGLGTQMQILFAAVGTNVANSFKKNFASGLADWLMDMAKPKGLLGAISLLSPALDALRIAEAAAAVELKKMSAEINTNIDTKTLTAQQKAAYESMTAEMKAAADATQILIDKKKADTAATNTQTTATAGLTTEEDKLAKARADALAAMNKEAELVTMKKAEEAARKWRTLWEDVATSIGGSMKTAWADIMMDAKNATDYLTNMLNSIQRAMHEAIFEKYIQPAITTWVGSMGTPAATSGGITDTGLPVDYGSVNTAIPGKQYGGLIPKIQTPVFAMLGQLVPKGTDTVHTMTTPGELIIPEKITEYFQKAFGNMGGGSQGQGSSSININVSAIDAKGTQQFLYQNRRAIASMLSVSGNENNPSRRQRK
jgi:hypothetical protein